MREVWMPDHQGGGGDVSGWYGGHGRWGGGDVWKRWGGIYEGVGVGSIERVGGMEGVGRWRCVEEAFGEITA